MSDAEMSAAAAEIVLIVAMAQDRVIGRDNDMPWRMSSDLKHFKALTMGRPMVMGRKTFQSIGRPLPGRTSIVVTRDAGFAAEGVILQPTLMAALELGREIAIRDGVGEVMVTGGGEIYAQALPLADRLEVTEIDLAVEGSVRFPAIDPAIWQEVSREQGERGPRDDAGYVFVSYRRRSSR